MEALAFMSRITSPVLPSCGSFCGVGGGIGRAVRVWQRCCRYLRVVRFSGLGTMISTYNVLMQCKQEKEQSEIADPLQDLFCVVFVYWCVT